MSLGDLPALTQRWPSSLWTVPNLPHARGWSKRIRVYFTGFEPFGSHAVNPSSQVAYFAAKALNADHRLERLFAVEACLPVTYDCAASWPEQTALACEVDEAIDAALFVHIGLAADRQVVCFERSAYNETSQHTRDNLGVLGREAGLRVDGRAKRQTALDVQAMTSCWDELAAPHLPRATVSDDAGRYICNAIFYHALEQVERIRRDGHTTDALFVHIPEVTDQQAQEMGAVLASVITQTVLALSSPM